MIILVDLTFELVNRDSIMVSTAKYYPWYNTKVSNAFEAQIRPNFCS